jgi:hypothetical protein
VHASETGHLIRMRGQYNVPSVAVVWIVVESTVVWWPDAWGCVECGAGGCVGCDRICVVAVSVVNVVLLIGCNVAGIGLELILYGDVLDPLVAGDVFDPLVAGDVLGTTVAGVADVPPEVVVVDPPTTVAILTKLVRPLAVDDVVGVTLAGIPTW